MDPKVNLRRYSVQENGTFPVQAYPGSPVNPGTEIIRQASYPNIPEGKVRHVSFPNAQMGLPNHIRQEIVNGDKMRRLSLQEHGKHVSFSQENIYYTDSKSESNRHVSFPNGPGTKKMRRYSVCAMPQQQQLYPKRM